MTHITLIGMEKLGKIMGKLGGSKDRNIQSNCVKGFRGFLLLIIDYQNNTSNVILSAQINRNENK